MSTAPSTVTLRDVSHSEPSTATQLAQFIRAKVKQAVKRFELRHIVREYDEDREGRIDFWDIDADAKIPELASEIASLAQNESNALGGVNAFVLIASDGTTEIARRGFRVNAVIAPGSVTPSEKPTLIGMRAQEMRHNEVHMQLGARSALEIIESYRVQVDDYRADLARVRAELLKEQEKRVEFLTTYEKITSESARRELEAARERRKDEAQREIFNKLTTLWPLLLHKMTGAKGSSLGGNHEDMLQALMTGLSREEMMRMLSVLPLEKQIVMWELLKSVLPPDPVTHDTTPPPPADEAA